MFFFVSGVLSRGPGRSTPDAILLSLSWQTQYIHRLLPIVMSKKFEYRGDLARTTLPEVFSTIHRFQVPGVIEARREELCKRVFIREGHVLHATSSNLEDSLGAYLLRTGELTQKQFDDTMRLRQSTEQRYGSLLVEQGLLGPDAVRAAIASQVESIVWSLFYWQEGEVTFSIGDVTETGMVQILLPIRQVIFSGIKRAPNAKALVARLGRKETVFEQRHNTETLIESGVSGEDYKLLQLVDGKRTLYEICMEGPLSPADNAKLLYAFHVLRVVQRQEIAPTSVRPDSKTGRVTIRMKTLGDSLS